MTNKLMRSRDIGSDNSNENEVNDNSTRILSYLLKREIKNFFQDHLTVIPLEHNKVRKFHGRFDDHEPLNHTSAVHFLRCLYSKNKRNDHRILSKDDEYAYNDTDVIISVVGDEIQIPDDIINNIDKEGETMYFNVSKVRKNRIVQFGSLRLFNDNEYSFVWGDSIAVSIELYEIKKTKFNSKDKFGDKKSYKLSDIGVIDIKDTYKKELQPFAVGFFQIVNTLNDQDSEKKKRFKRDLTQLILERSYHPPKVRKDIKNNVECGVRKFEFSFADFGWDNFVIAPSSFDLSYYAGSCPISRFYSNHLPIHSYLRILAHDIYPNSIPIPCCAPIKFDSLDLLYYGHKDNILLEKLKRISITQCECL
ncbi:uncharacterized protein LOC141538286 [Cotesia typhae]|uniref:uncharacterized protein LOC141538286 n=1 Tax=Cotesia typhae TaxID=2053667 RepID=UPI003D6976A1